MNDALRIILATTRAQDASAANAAHGEGLDDNATFDAAVAATQDRIDALEWAEQKDAEAHARFVVSIADPADDLARCTATAAECLKDGRDALMDAADEQDEKYAALLPGSYYMDPPDGGSVSVLEQLRRMAEDAARYRWAIAREDNAEALYAAVLYNSPNIGDIEYEVDVAMNGRFA